MITLTTHSAHGKELLTYYNFNVHEMETLRGALAVRIHMIKEHLAISKKYGGNCAPIDMTDDDLEKELALVEELYNKMKGE